MAAAALPPQGPAGDLATGDVALVARRAAARTIDTLLTLGLCFALYGFAFAFPGLDGTGVFLIALDVTFLAYQLHELLGVAFWGRTRSTARAAPACGPPSAASRSRPPC